MQRKAGRPSAECGVIKTKIFSRGSDDSDFRFLTLLPQLNDPYRYPHIPLQAYQPYVSCGAPHFYRSAIKQENTYIS